MTGFDRTTLIGVVFDLSLAHGNDGARNVDSIKDTIIKSLVESKELTKVYVSHPDWQTVPRDQGESTYYVISYAEPPKFRIDTAFRGAVSVVGECAEDCDKYVFLITDRFQAPVNYQYRKGFLTNNIRDYGTKICVFGLGEHYDQLTLKSIVDEYDSQFFHLKDSSEFSVELIKKYFGG